MDPFLLHLLLERLLADDGLDDTRRDLVLAACEGPEALEAELSGAADSRELETVQPELPSDPPGAYLRSISVTGFRGVGPSAALDLTPGPGLTLVVGRNGSGKSSFAEGLELLMTGANLRWQKRTKIWREGWQNLHYGGDTSLSAELHIDGSPGTVRLERTWPRGSEVTTPASLTVGGGVRSIAELGWDAALSRYRPFLSYSELGTMFDQLPTMYDALAAILGLEDVDTASAVLREGRLQRDRAMKAYKQRRDELLQRLGGCDDERARAVERGLSGKEPDLDTVELALEGVVEGPDPATELGLLGQIARLNAGDEGTAAAAIAAVETTQAELAALAGTDAARDAALAALLEQALAHRHDYPGDRCPVCGTDGVLDAAWRARASDEAKELRRRARTYDAAVGAVATTQRRVAEAVPRLDPAAIADIAARVKLDASALGTAWERWRAETDRRPMDAAALSDALESLRTSVQQLANAAQTELTRRDDAWRPIATELREWLPSARAAVAGCANAVALKEAEAWMKAVAADLQAERLAPIAEAAKRNWMQLRQESNVSLDGFHLRRSGNARSAEVDVRVDGAESYAFGVMSQGELHALAVSVFLPRAGFRESPFRFMVIDDPVQSMDPSKVDGLARVLAETARDRQVIVFTHDERLPEAARRLNLDATILEVTRRPGSVVHVRRALDPIERYIEDARALLAGDEVPVEVVTRVVPGFCRHALEAGATEAVRRRRLARGDGHVAVEAALDRATTLYMRLALALFDDEGRGGHVLTRINQQFGRGAGNAVLSANKGVHEDLAGDLRDFVRETARLARALAELP
jgi:recombinational DNA repair ATPase RecF